MLPEITDEGADFLADFVFMSGYQDWALPLEIVAGFERI
jgi:hypothetical protein